MKYVLNLHLPIIHKRKALPRQGFLIFVRSVPDSSQIALRSGFTVFGEGSRLFAFFFSFTQYLFFFDGAQANTPACGWL